MHLPYKARKLAKIIDSGRILAELLNCSRAKWLRHNFHATGHDVIPLLTRYGNVVDKKGEINAALILPFVPVGYLEDIPYLKEVIYSFGSPPGRVSLTKMKAGDTMLPIETCTQIGIIRFDCIFPLLPHLK